MRLSNRIHTIVDAVSSGETVADIGTDHGYVPMLLIKKGISPYAIMSDISEDSLSKAVATFNLCTIDSNPEQFRIGNGLEKIKPNEVDDIIIAGLGGMTIISILSDDIDKSRSFRKLILHPRTHSGELRYFLYTSGWDIVKEALAQEGKFICEIITAIPSEENYRSPLYEKGDIRWNYPLAMVNTDPILFIKKLKYKLYAIDEGLSNLSKSKYDQTDTIARLKKDRIYIIDLLSTINSDITG